MDLHGIQFTSSNKRFGEDCIQAHLDRVLISPDWAKDFLYKVEASQKIGSDHFPLIFMAVIINIKKKFPFRFEKMWMQHPQFQSKLIEWWNIDVDGTTLYRIVTKLKNVKKEVKIWNKECFGNIFEIKEKIKEDLHKIQDTIQIDGYNPDLVSKENQKMAQ